MLSNSYANLAEGKNIMGREEDLRWKIDVCDAQLSNFESFKGALREIGLDLDTPYVDPSTIDDPLARRIFSEAQDDYMESREGLYGRIGEVAAKRARLQAELDRLEGRNK